MIRHSVNTSRQIPHHRIDDEETIFKKYELGRKLGQVSFFFYDKNHN